MTLAMKTVDDEARRLEEQWQLFLASLRDGDGGGGGVTKNLAGAIVGDVGRERKRVAVV